MRSHQGRVRLINYKGYLVWREPKRYSNGDNIYVYEGFAFAYVGGKGYPPSEFFLTEVDTMTEAKDYIDSTIIAMNRGIEANRRKIYGTDCDMN